MSVVFSGTLQGTFTSDGNAKLLNIRTDIDWMWVYNQTKLYAAGANNGAQFYWQRGMASGQGTKYIKENTIGALVPSQLAAGTGFYLIDTSVNTPGASVALTAISNDDPPVVSTGDTSSINNGDIVRIYSTVGALQLGGLDFTIGNIVDNTSFELSYMSQIAAANAGTWRRIPYDPYYYPRTRTISAITQASNAVVTLTVTHNFTVGQAIRFVIPRVSSLAYGMTELDGVEANITAVDTANNTITVDVDTSGYTAFAFPLTTDGGFTPAQVVPVGEDTALANSNSVNPFGDAELNTAYIGMRLMGGATSPGGANNDVMYWVAGKSFNQ